METQRLEPRKLKAQRLDGKVAVISGGGRGLGAAIAELVAAQGAAVVMTARTGSEIEALAQRIRDGGGKALAVRADVASLEDCRAVIDKTLGAFGRVDFLVNNAAVAHPFQRIEEVDPQAWVKAVEINLMGSFYLARFALPAMLAQGAGWIVNVSSGLALNARIGQSAYCVSKAGLEMLMRGLALETEGTGVVVTSYDPGMIDTPMQEEQRALDAEALRVDTEMFHAAWRESRLRDPRYVAKGILWLLGEHGAGANGQRFSINDAAWREGLEQL